MSFSRRENNVVPYVVLLCPGVNRLRNRVTARCSVVRRMLIVSLLALSRINFRIRLQRNRRSSVLQEHATVRRPPMPCFYCSSRFGSRAQMLTLDDSIAHIHCVFLLLDPSRLDTNIATGQEASASIGNSFPGSGASSTSGVLDNDFDLQAFRVLQGKTSMCSRILRRLLSV